MPNENRSSEAISRKLFCIQEISGAGLGVVATKKIEAGETIMKEKPLLLIPAEAKSDRYSWKEKVKFLESLVASLSTKQRKEYFSLFDAKCSIGNKKSAEGIFRTNNFALGFLTPQTDHGIFTKISRLNHSCGPNCEVVWKAEVGYQEVVAIRDIEEWEELNICYLNMEGRVRTARDRNMILKQYGFYCFCKFCKEEDKVLEIKRFQEICRILERKGTDELKKDNLLQLYLEKEKILVLLESKIIWRINNLKEAAKVCVVSDEYSEDMAMKIERKLKYLQSILYRHL